MAWGNYVCTKCGREFEGINGICECGYYAFKIRKESEDRGMAEIRNLNTIQKRNKLNTVVFSGEKGPGGAYHEYLVYVGEAGVHQTLFQKGPRNEEGSIRGVLDVDLLEMVRHRLQCFQQGEYSTRENAIALTHIEEALLWMNKRVEDRADRDVLGTTQV